MTLRAPGPDDLAGAIERYLESPGGSFGAEDARRWVTYGITEAWAAGSQLVFVIEYDGRYAGSVGLKPDSMGNASVHFGLAAWAQGAGVAARAVRLVLEFGFETCGFHVIHWWAAAGNWPSRRVAWATGFRAGPTIEGLAEMAGRRTDAWTGWILPGDRREARQRWLEVPVLETSRIRLRTWRDDEIDRITTARTNQATAHFLPFIPQPFAAEDARWWLKDMAEQAAAGRRFNWCIADASTDLGLGNLTLFNLGPDGDGELGYWAHPDAQGRGIMTEAIRTVASWFFAAPADNSTAADRAPVAGSGFGGARLVIRTAATNKAARKVAESAGFRHAGTEREAFRLSTHPDDRVTYDLLASDQVASSGAMPSST
ncbi:GNAT family N-acetyltransferase [Kribbella qitaiheensis]|uniref:GNAT family N-acetyltransferase n=1 Tax=Kribbella qitaiheensis TaxID=1544730 RepID=A0A7G6X9H4_9ACTN|nr:GNAT family N-acetyltransferase [Kribbella qitaiheensis]